MALNWNGNTIPVAGALAIVALIVWAIRLEGIARAADERSRANADKAVISQQSDAEMKERLVRVEEQTRATSKDVDEIKDEQKEQSKKLDKILEKLAER